jgi:hypothetical protein
MGYLMYVYEIMEYVGWLHHIQSRIRNQVGIVERHLSLIQHQNLDLFKQSTCAVCGHIYYILLYCANCIGCAFIGLHHKN